MFYYRLIFYYLLVCAAHFVYRLRPSTLNDCVLVITLWSSQRSSVYSDVETPQTSVIIDIMCRIVKKRTNRYEFYTRPVQYDWARVLSIELRPHRTGVLTSP